MFEGFPKELPDFLWGLALNNEKPWFEAHRDEYERVLQTPMRALAFEICDRVQERWPKEAPALHISRINRDARRLHGRGPYNDHLWFTLAKRSGIYEIQPCLWFEIGAAKYAYGLGFWMGGGGAAERWRAQIDAEPATLERLVRKLEKQSVFTRGGESYKRAKAAPSELLAPWYNARSVELSRTVWFEPDPPGRELADEMMRDLEILMPLYRYMCRVTV